jgi:hypothetical protein
VKEDGVGPSAGPGELPAKNFTPPQWKSDSNPRELVRDFLQAAAGDYAVDVTREGALTRVKNFVAEDGAGWDPGPNLTLVRVVDGPTQDGDRVKVKVQHLGVLDSDGRVEPLDGSVQEYQFVFSRAEGKSGLFLTNPPPDLLFNVENLESYYLKLPIYFWNKNKTSLVPDVRYLPRALPAEQHSNRLVDWLLKGPAPWLKDVVLDLPTGASRADLIVKDGELIKVNLVAPESDLEKLAIQLFWSLAPSTDERILERIQLRVNRNEYTVDDAKARQWLTAADQGQDLPRQYGIADGALRRLKTPEGAYQPLLKDEKLNHGVVAAAVAHDESGFALVRQEGDVHRLYVRTGKEPLRRIQFPGNVTSLSQPMWLDRAAEVMLVLGDGRLWAVGARDGTASEVRRSKLPTSKITAYSVAPDGRRLALVVGGRLYVAPLLRVNANAVSFNVGEPQRVPTGFDGQLRGVGFIREDTVAVGVSTADEKVWLAEVTIDGAVQKPYSTGQSGNITNLTAYVEGGGRRQRAGTVMLDLNGKGYRVFPSVSSALLDPLVNQAVLPVPSSGPSASPSASPSVPAEVTVSAPVFEG